MDETVVVASGPNFMFLGIGGTGIACFASVVWLYNLWIVIGMVRDAEAEAASGLAKGAWALSMLAWFVPGCGLLVLGPIAVIMSRMVTGQVYREEASISSNIPAGMASINVGLLVVYALMFVVVGFIGTST